MAARLWRLLAVTVWLVVLAGSVQSVNYECHPFPTNSQGTIEPRGDIVTEVGKEYEAVCIFDTTRVSAGDVYFRSRVAGGSSRIPHMKVNDSAIHVRVTHQEPTSYYLECMYGNDSMCNRQVSVGYPPQDVENFTCISRNYMTLNCSWTAPYNPVTVSYNLTYVVPGFLNTRTCPKKIAARSWCFISQSHFHGGRDAMIMTFVATNQLSERTYVHNVSIFESVIPDHAEDLVAEVKGSREVLVSWVMPHPIDTFPGNVIQELSYRMKQAGGAPIDDSWHMFDMWEEKMEQFNPTKKFWKMVDRLHPHVEYEFKVRLHTGVGPIRENMWSAPANVTNTTAATRPTKAPQMTVGMFEVEELRSQRSINIMWQSVDRVDWNGPDFHYIIKVYDNTDSRLVYTSDAIVGSNAKMTNLSKETPFRFEVIPVNDEGPPEDENLKASLVVPEMSAVLQTPQYFRVIAYTGHNNSTYRVLWQLPEQSVEVESVTLYWCRQLEYENWCKTKVQWRKVDSPTAGAVNLTGFDPSTRYMFGISLESKSSSSGIKWISCVAEHGVKPPRIEDFSEEYVYSTSVGMKWDLNCKAQAAEPRGFKISYCHVLRPNDTCADSDETFVDIDNELQTTYEIGNLHPYSHYHFYIATKTDIGLSHWSRPLRVTTEPDKPSGPPLHLRLKEKGQGWVVLTWNPPQPEDRNGKIVSYQAYGDNIRGVRVTAREPETSHNFTNLDDYTEYKFEVKACSQGINDMCGNESARTTVRTKIGSPGKIGSINQRSNSELEWEFEDCNGPKCTFELLYNINGTVHTHSIPAGRVSVDISKLNITCLEGEEKPSISMRGVGWDEENHRLDGPWTEKQLECFSTGPPVYVIIVIAIISVCMAVVLFYIFTCGRERIKRFMEDIGRDISVPLGLDTHHEHTDVKIKWWEDLIPVRVPHESRIPVDPIKTTEKQDLIKSGSERQGGRNLSGDSGTSVGDNNDSSGCSTGGDSDCSSGTDGLHPSSDSGTVQEEPGFPLNKKSSGEVRFRPITSAPPYVYQGLPETRSYVSVPNLAVGLANDGVGSALPPSTSGLGMLGTEMGMNGRRTSTGYFSMPTSETKESTVPLSNLGNMTLPHEHCQGYLPAYSRHNYPYKKVLGLNPPYIKAQSLPWLNAGYVAVAQADAMTREAPQTQGYVAVGSEDIPGMKHQSSLLSIPVNDDKSPSTPDEDLPTGAYCRVGARDSPTTPPSANSPPPAYVSVTPDLSAFMTPRINPPIKSPYVTCAMAEALSSPTKQLEKGKYVSGGDIAGGRWAHNVLQSSLPEETRDVLSAPVEGSRGRAHHLPTRPNTTETSSHHNRGGLSRFAPLGLSLSKQSSGYASGNVSQETLSFHDPVVMSPKKLLARSQEPHSVVYSPNHNSSMV